MLESELLEIAYENFKWDSQAQKEGWLALVKIWNDHGKSVELPLDCYANLAFLFFIQKMYESDLQWTELVGNQVRDLQDQVHKNQEEIASLRRELAEMAGGLKMLGRVTKRAIRSSHGGTA